MTISTDDIKPAISVIIPVYNTEKYLRECLDSVLAQTFTDFELILIDDGSTDGSPAICDAYAVQDHRVRVFHQENQGQAATRNFGVTQAAAEWIAFVDADDVVHPQYLEVLYRSVLKQNTQLSMCGAVEGDRVPDDFLRTTADPACEVFLADDSAMFDLREHHLLKYCDVWAKLVHRTVIEKYPFADGRIFEDAAVVCRWIVSANVVSNLTWGGYFYRKNPEGTMNRITKKWWEDSLWSTREQLLYFHDLGFEKMTARMMQGYCYAARDAYLHALEEDPSEAQQIKREFAAFEKRFQAYIKLSENELEWIRAAFYPKKTRLASHMRKGIRK